jgi:hypothetical protein
LDTQRARTTRRQKNKPGPCSKHEDRTWSQSKLSPGAFREEGLRAFIMVHDKDENALKINFFCTGEPELPEKTIDGADL